MQIAIWVFILLRNNTYELEPYLIINFLVL